MRPQYKRYVPKGTYEILDHLASMTVSSPTFIDKAGDFPELNIDTEFEALNESLLLIREPLGEERYQTLISLSDRMRAHFEADQEDKTDDSLKGRELIFEMEDILIAAGDIDAEATPPELIETPTPD